jgi:agmatine deiminase
MRREAGALACLVAILALATVTGACGQADADQPAKDGPAVNNDSRTPGEHERQEATLMAWPYKTAIWEDKLAPLQAEIAAIARAIAAHQPVTMAAAPGHEAEARRACGPGVQVVGLEYDDCWTRDTGPIGVYRAGERIGLDWRFNCWGGKFPPWEKDDAFAAEACAALGMPAQPVDMVLEGGAVIIDGEGTLITTEECLLNENRNPDMTKAEIETTLKAEFGVTEVIWLPYGLAGDTITDGHVDGVAAFARPGVLVVQAGPAGTPDHERLAKNRAVLERATDARGRHFELIEMRPYPTLSFGSYETSHSYVNYYVCNGAVIVPLCGRAADDAAALATLRAAFPEREVVGVVCPTVTYGGGGVHCVTQQVIPAL